MPRLFVIAGEASGDAHGAGVLRRLQEQRPGLEIHGLGGPQMHALDPQVEDWIDQAAVVGLWEVLRHYRWFRRQFDEQLRRIRDLAPDVVLLIDYPGFNLRLAKALRNMSSQRGRPRVVYFISPQVWAWHRGRIPSMARCLDLMLCIFPFEADLYNASGLRTLFVGHPLAERLGPAAPDEERQPNLVGLFPGSREREVARHFPLLLEAARLLHARHPHLEFTASAASPRLARLMARLDDQAGLCRVETGTARSLMRRAAAGVVASGTATLEAAFCGLPYCLIYRVAWPTYAAGRLLIRVPHLGIVNILAGRELVRELIQRHATPERVADEVERLLTDLPAREELLAGMQQVVDALGGGGAYGRAADAILPLLDSGAQPPGPAGVR